MLASWVVACVLAGFSSLLQAPRVPVAQSVPDVQTIDRDALTRSADTVTAADVDRLIEVVFKIGARIEDSLTGPAAADARRELDRLRDDVSTLHGRVRGGARMDAAPYVVLQKQLLTLAQKVGSPFR
jgi:hypothetical protein